MTAELFFDLLLVAAGLMLGLAGAAYLFGRAIRFAWVGK